MRFQRGLRGIRTDLSKCVNCDPPCDSIPFIDFENTMGNAKCECLETKEMRSTMQNAICNAKYDAKCDVKYEVQCELQCEMQYECLEDH